MVIDGFFELCKNVLLNNRTGKIFLNKLIFNPILDNETKGLVIDAMSNIYETCKIFNLTTGGDVGDIKGTGISYNQILENLGMFDILEQLQTTPELDLYQKVYDFILEYLPIIDGY